MRRIHLATAVALAAGLIGALSACAPAQSPEKTHSYNQ